MTLVLKRSVVAAGLAMLCTVGFGKAQTANLLATETANPDTAVLTPDTAWDMEGSKVP